MATQAFYAENNDNAAGGGGQVKKSPWILRRLVSRRDDAPLDLRASSF